MLWSRNTGQLGPIIRTREINYHLQKHCYPKNTLQLVQLFSNSSRIMHTQIKNCEEEIFNVFVNIEGMKMITDFAVFLLPMGYKMMFFLFLN